MGYKMIVLDLDDTLLRDDQTISDRTKKAILQAQEEGVKVVLASGRPTYGMRWVADELQLDHYGSYILPFNGSKIINYKSNEEMYSRALSAETAHRLYDLSKREGVGILTYSEDAILVEEPDEFADIESRLTGLPVEVVPDFKEAVKGPVVKALMLKEADRLKEVEVKLQEELDGELSVMRSKPYFLEFTQLGVTKGATLDYLIEPLGIKREEVIAIGDSYNDLTMLEFAGLGVAMGNAPDDIKEKADHVTSSNMDDGVAEVVEKFVLNRLSRV
ncbi:Cof-type HAD-IIB family hydrolase [Rossellomorea aquimaris]|uniref:Cof-type HAD-IIB family hydrolase n=1 Tax=Rossellomorea aquimaris TaxID=189382 RepID=UPI001CD5214C|nr:Cof-type HAD-IIB family hydrolase [Rossellomorea aquimaris]MCA1057193.1 Cof-type HAD-IIB family hydrolase [Rossellomorea aquimaris]